MSLNCSPWCQESKKVGKQSFMYAWVLDETEEERSRQCIHKEKKADAVSTEKKDTILLFILSMKANLENKCKILFATYIYIIASRLEGWWFSSDSAGTPHFTKINATKKF